ncbi:MAG TPA: clostripain-related cysteine peptidase [Candidatus Xenobia bacterium]
MPAIADWTVLVYSSASSDIVKVARQALAEVGRAHRGDRVEIAAQLGTPDAMQRTDFRRTTQGAPVDMSAPQTLTDFLRWGQQTHPAHHYLVVLGGHASGFMGAVTSPDRSRVMAPPDMVKAIADSGMHPDVTVLNACLEQQVGVGLALSQVTDFLIGSQAEEHAEGMALGDMVAGLHAGETPAQVATASARLAAAPAPRTWNVSALDLRALRTTATALDQVGKAIVDAGQQSAMRQVMAGLPGYREEPDVVLNDLKDVGFLSQSLQSAPFAPPVRSAAQALQETLPATVLSSTSHLNPRPWGLSTWMPTAPSGIPRVDAMYRTLMAQAAPHWVQAVLG